MSEYITPN